MDGRMEMGASSTRIRGVSAVKPRVLVIDDDPRLRDVLALVLADDCEVALAASGGEALQRLRTERYDAIVCDLSMPGIGGIELHARLTESQPDSAARMIIVTGGAYSLSAEKFLEQSSCPKVPKPFTPPELMAAVETILTRHGRALRRAG